jgi:hypothetical protein
VGLSEGAGVVGSRALSVEGVEVTGLPLSSRVVSQESSELISV